MVGIALGLVTAWLQAPAVTYQCKAKPVQAVLDDLAKIAKVDLTAKAEVRPEIVLISVKNMPISDLLGRIAKVTSCQWERTESGFVLEADEAARNREKQAETAKLAAIYRRDVEADLRETIKDQADEDAQKPKGDDTSNDPVSGILPAESDAERIAVSKLLELADYTEMAQLSPNTVGKVWVSNNPTGAQLLLQEGSEEIVDKWISSHNAALEHAASLEVAQADATIEEQAAVAVEIAKIRAAMVEGPVGQVAISVSKTLTWPRLSATATVYGLSPTDILLQGSTRVCDPPEDSDDEKAPPRPKTPIAFSEDAKNFKVLFGGSLSEHPKRFQGPPEFLRSVMEVDRVDPLSYVASEAILAFAQSKGRQVVADLPDTVTGVEAPSSGPNVSLDIEAEGLSYKIYEAFSQTGADLSTLEDVGDEFKRGGPLQMDDDGAVLSIMSSAPSSDRAVRIDRASLRTLLQAAPDSFMPSLPALAAYSLHNVSLYDNPVSGIYARRFLRSLMDPAASWEGLRFVGLLDQEQLSALEQGGKISFSALTQSQLAQIAVLVSGGEPTSDDGKPSHPQFPLVPGLQLFNDAPVDELDLALSRPYHPDPIDLLATGIPANGFVSADVLQETVFYTGDGNGATSNFCLDGNEVAILKEEGKSGSTTVPRLGFVGSRSLIDLMIHLAPNIATTCDLVDMRVPRAAERVALDQLPADFQAQLKTTEEQVAREKSELNSEPPPP